MSQNLRENKIKNIGAGSAAYGVRIRARETPSDSKKTFGYIIEAPDNITSGKVTKIFEKMRIDLNFVKIEIFAQKFQIRKISKEITLRLSHRSKVAPGCEMLMSSWEKNAFWKTHWV